MDRRPRPAHTPLVPNWDARAVALTGGPNAVSGMAAAEAAYDEAAARAAYYRRLQLPAGTVIYDEGGRLVYRRD